VNRVLLHAEEIFGDRAVLGGRRAGHILGVIDADEGDRLRVGVIGGKLGEARVVARSSDSVTLDLRLIDEPPPPSPATLVLALPRPKVARRVLIDAAAAGVKQIHFVGAWKVDKSYWSSPLLDRDAVARHLVLGLEQGGDTIMPTVSLHRLFKPFVEDVLPGLVAGLRRFVAHPRSDVNCPRAVDGPFALAVGPERGFTPYEVGRLEEAGFAQVSLGQRALRVEAVVTTLLGRLG